MNIFELSMLQIKREGKLRDKNIGILLIDRAYKIRKYLDISERNKQVAENRYEKANFFAKGLTN